MSGPLVADHPAERRRTRWWEPGWWDARRFSAALIAIIALAGLIGRLWNVDFDQRQHQHPDERFWALTSAAMAETPPPAPHGTILGPVLDWLDGDRSPASVYRATPSFVYGPISLATAQAAASWLHDGVVEGRQPAAALADLLDTLGVPLVDDAGAPRFDTGYQVDLIGRLQGAFLDTITIVVVAAIGRRLGGHLAGVLAAAFTASSVMSIQLAHFFGAEPLLGLGSALIVLCMLRLDRGADLRRAATSGLLLGMSIGLTVAAKLTALGIVLVPIAACAGLVLRHHRRSDAMRLASVLVGAALAFRVAHPGAFDGLGLRFSDAYWADLRLTATLPDLETPPSFQWARRIPVLQPLAWLSVYVIGPGTVLAAAVGIGALVRRRSEGARAMPTWTRLVTLASIVMPFAYVVVATFPTTRYFLPMTPAMFAVAGFGTAPFVRRLRTARGRARIAPIALVTAGLGLSVVWALGFVHGVYGREHTRIEATRWIADNVPPGSALTSQAWDDALPLALPGIDVTAYRNVQLVMVEPDSVAKVDALADQLLDVDYVIESSERISGTVTRMPARFPSTINFFEALDSGALGFQRIVTIERGIELFGLRLPGGAAEEAFNVYDHPPVRIWQRVADVDRSTIVDTLDPSAAANAVAFSAFDAHANGLMLHSDEIARNAVGPTYDEAFDTDGSPWVHALRWFVVLELLGAAAFVLLLPLFRRLPDAGLGLSKLVALAFLAVTLFVAVAWFRLPFDRWLVIATAASLLVVGVVVGTRRRSELLELWRERRAVLITVEVLGATMFVALVMLRAANPDLWHPFRSGEKPFELALLTAVLRTRTLPVYDPWFSGGSLNYYYGGWLLLAVPARLARTSPSSVMNLAPALFAMCSAGAVFTAGSAIVDMTRRRWHDAHRARTRSIVAGLAAVALALAASNASVLRQRWRALTQTPSPPFDWWAPSRVIPDSVAITEFPAWSFLFADVHPHFMNIGVLVSIVPVCIVLHHALAEARTRRAVTAAIAAGMLIGLVRMTNTWDLPLGAGLVSLTFVAAAMRRVPWKVVVPAGCTVVAVVAVGFAPYTWRGLVFDSGFEPAELRTPWWSWMEQFGAFAVITLLAVIDRRSIGRRRSRIVWRSWREAHVAIVAGALVGLGFALRRPDDLVLVTCLALAGAGAWSGWRSLGDRRSRRSPIAPALLAIGWSIQAGVELFTVRNDGGRTNTVFKFWYQSWLLLALGAAVVLTEIVLRHRRSSGRSDDRPPWLLRATLVVMPAIMTVSAAFWTLATPARTADRLSRGGVSLDGEAYLRLGHDDDLRRRRDVLPRRRHGVGRVAASERPRGPRGRRSSRHRLPVDQPHLVAHRSPDAARLGLPRDPAAAGVRSEDRDAPARPARALHDHRPDRDRSSARHLRHRLPRLRHSGAPDRIAVERSSARLVSNAFSSRPAAPETTATCSWRASIADASTSCARSDDQVLIRRAERAPRCAIDEPPGDVTDARRSVVGQPTSPGGRTARSRTRRARSAQHRWR